MSADEDIGEFGSEGEEELSEARSRGQKRKRRKTSLQLPTVLRYLNADEYMAIEENVLNRFFTYYKYFDSLKYVTAFDSLFEKYVQSQAQQQVSMPPPPEYREEKPEVSPLPPPSNPIEAVLFKIVDKVIDEAINRIFKSEKLQRELEDMVKSIVASTAEGVAREHIAKILSQEGGQPSNT